MDRFAPRSRRRRSGTLAASTATGTKTRTETERNFMPSRRVTIPAGDEETVTFRGDNGAAFGIDHLTVGGGYDGLLASASTENGNRFLFQPVHLSALRDLFLRRRLKGLLKIKEANELTLRLQNPTNAERTVIVQLAGYSGQAAIERQEACLNAEHAPDADAAPEVKLTVSRESVPAEAQDYEVDVDGRAFPVAFSRFLVGADVDLATLRVALKLYGGDVVLPQVYASQLQDAFREMEATRPWLVEPRTPLKLVVTNDSGVEADVSVLFESYRQ